MWHVNKLWAIYGPDNQNFLALLHVLYDERFLLQEPVT